MTIHLDAGVRQAMLDAWVDKLDAGAAAGYVEIRSGVQPANVAAAATGTLLVEITLADPAFAAASGPSVDLDADPDLQGTAVAAGTATWARWFDSDDNKVFDCSVSETGGGGDLIITQEEITIGQIVVILSGSLSLPD